MSLFPAVRDTLYLLIQRAVHFNSNTVLRFHLISICSESKQVEMRMERSSLVLFHTTQIEPSLLTTHIIFALFAPLIPRYSKSLSSISWMPQISSNQSVTCKVASQEHCGDCTHTRFYPHTCHTPMRKHTGEENPAPVLESQRKQRCSTGISHWWLQIRPISACTK